MSRKPTTIAISGDRYVATVFQIVEKDPDGCFRVLRVLGDHEEITLGGGEEFMIAYVPKKMLRKSAGKA